MLTAPQSRLLEYIKACADDGWCPTFRQMQDAMGLHSISSVHRLVVALAERNFIRRIPNRQCAIQVVTEPALIKQDPTTIVIESPGRAPLWELPLAVLQSELSRRGYSIVANEPAA